MQTCSHRESSSRLAGICKCKKFALISPVDEEYSAFAKEKREIAHEWLHDYVIRSWQTLGHLKMLLEDPCTYKSLTLW